MRYCEQVKKCHQDAQWTVKSVRKRFSSLFFFVLKQLDYMSFVLFEGASTEEAIWLECWAKIRDIAPLTKSTVKKEAKTQNLSLMSHKDFLRWLDSFHTANMWSDDVLLSMKMCSLVCLPLVSLYANSHDGNLREIPTWCWDTLSKFGTEKLFRLASCSERQ